VVPGDGEVPVVDDPRRRGRERGIVLAEDRERLGSQLVQDGDHESLQELSYEGAKAGNVKRIVNPLTEKVVALMAWPMRIYRG
jgi:hypothetical protein